MEGGKLNVYGPFSAEFGVVKTVILVCPNLYNLFFWC